MVELVPVHLDLTLLNVNTFATCVTTELIFIKKFKLTYSNIPAWNLLNVLFVPLRVREIPISWHTYEINIELAFSPLFHYGFKNKKSLNEIIFIMEMDVSHMWSWFLLYVFHQVQKLIIIVANIARILRYSN